MLWRRTGRRPSRVTFGFLALALAGVALVISGGHPTTIVSGSIGWGDGLVLAGVFSFVLYGLGAAQFRDFSPLRYTALTAGLGWLTIAAATAVALGAGLVSMPSGSTLVSVTPQIAYLALPGAFVAVLTWNAAIGLIGPQNAVLFGNLIPVTTFVDRDRPRLPAERGRARRRRDDDRGARREQPRRAPAGARRCAGDRRLRLRAGGGRRVTPRRSGSAPFDARGSGSRGRGTASPGPLR